MIRYTWNGLEYYTFSAFERVGVKHAVFTRHGGVSKPPWASLNFGALVGDDPLHVAENYRRAFDALNCPLESRYDVWQVHSADIAIAEAPRLPEIPHVKADIILTNRMNITLFMRFADCVPIMLCDPVNRVIGIVHAGWQGTVKKACAAAVESMRDHYGCLPANIVAGIGPSISPQRYEVGDNVIQHVRDVFGSAADELLPTLNGSVHFDLWNANAKILELCGVSQVEISEICTAQYVNDWYSHREERGITGRFGALITLV